MYLSSQKKQANVTVEFLDQLSENSFSPIKKLKITKNLRFDQIGKMKHSNLDLDTKSLN